MVSRVLRVRLHDDAAEEVRRLARATGLGASDCAELLVTLGADHPMAALARKGAGDYQPSLYAARALAGGDPSREGLPLYAHSAQSVASELAGGSTSEGPDEPELPARGEHERAS